jgi:hypothetical protein
MFPYRFQRSGSGHFIRATDCQRNPPPWTSSANYNIYAQHDYYGYPPWNLCGQASRSDNPGATPVPHDDSWIDGISGWMMDIHAEGGAVPPPVDQHNLPTRYTVSETVLTSDPGTGPSTIYRYVVQMNPHNGVVRWIYFMSIAWNGGTAYTYTMDNSGNVTQTGLAPDFTQPSCVPIGAANQIMSTMSVVWTDLPRTATVTANSISYSETHNYVGGSVVFAITNTLSNSTPTGSPIPAQPWGLGPLISEMCAMLALIDFSNPSATYKIDGVTRVLDPLGEQIVITPLGPAPGQTDLYVMNSGGSGSGIYLGQLSCNINDVVSNGVYDTAPPGGFSGETIYYMMEKSMVHVPAGAYALTAIGHVQPTPDTNILTDDGHGNGVIGADNGMDNGDAITPHIFDDTLVSPTTFQLTVYPGPFIDVVTLAVTTIAPPAGIDSDGTRIDQDGRIIDGGIHAPPAGVDQDGTRIDQDGRRIDQS